MHRQVEQWCANWRTQTLAQQIAQTGHPGGDALLHLLQCHRVRIHAPIDGTIVMGTVRTAETQGELGFSLAHCFHDFQGSPDPGPYLLRVRDAYQQGTCYHEKHEGGVLCRALVAFPSMLRSLHAEGQFMEVFQRTHVPLSTLVLAKSTSWKRDMEDKCDAYFALMTGIHVWSYMDSPDGIYHLRCKLTGSRGPLPHGLHLLLPLSGGWARECHKWWFHSTGDVERCLRQWQEGRIWEYSHLLQAFRQDRSEMLQQPLVLRVAPPEK